VEEMRQCENIYVIKEKETNTPELRAVPFAMPMYHAPVGLVLRLDWTFIFQ